MFKHILLPTDGSKLSNKAVKQAISLASQLGARIIAMNAAWASWCYENTRATQRANRD